MRRSQRIGFVVTAFALFSSAVCWATETGGIDPSLEDDGTTRVLPPGVEIIDGVPTQAEPFRNLGPTLAFGIPHPITLEVEYKFNPYFSVALSAGGLNLPYHKGGIDVNVGISAFDLRGRWHPWGGSFFLGLILGGQSIYGKGNDVIAVPGYGDVSVAADAELKNPYITPHFGWFWEWRSGFTLGLELGCQIPLSADTKVTISTGNIIASEALAELQAQPQYQELYAKVQNVGDHLGGIPLPYVTALRIGWLF